MAYIHQIEEWPKFHWDRGRLADRLGAVRGRQTRLVRRMASLGCQASGDATLHSLTAEIIHSSESAGQVLDEACVRGALARRLGMDGYAPTPADRHVEGAVEVMLDATQMHAAPLTRERLFAWHAALFPSGRGDRTRFPIGAWREDRSGRVLIASGPIDRQVVHYEAPAAPRLGGEMRAFLRWFNARDETDLVLKAGIAHLWFATIHPFDDGNGRVAGALTNLMLARSEHSARRFYSLARQIRRERDGYHAILEVTRKAGLDITPWIDWFLGCLGRALEDAETTWAPGLNLARFWEEHSAMPFNARQRGMLDRLLVGVEGKVTSSQWATLAKCSRDTALRDIGGLVRQRVLVQGVTGGRGTSYSLAAD